jgi:hypothetical protein
MNASTWKTLAASTQSAIAVAHPAPPAQQSQRARAEPSQTWKASVESLQAAKVHRTDHGAPTYVEQRAAIYDKHRPHPMREGVGRFAGFHPLLGQYRDVAKEAAAAHAEWEHTLLRGNSARDAQLRFTQDHDLISKWPRVEQPPPPPPAKTSRTFGGSKPFHILSGEPIPLEQQSDQARSVKPARFLADYRPSLVRRRAVDITSNEYLVSNSAGAGSRASSHGATRCLRAVPARSAFAQRQRAAWCAQLGVALGDSALNAPERVPA